jgi:hypothetical protein
LSVRRVTPPLFFTHTHFNFMEVIFYEKLF